jgi:hypothetical protein
MLNIILEKEYLKKKKVILHDIEEVTGLFIKKVY